MYLEMKNNNSKADLKAKLLSTKTGSLVPGGGDEFFACQLL